VRFTHHTNCNHTHLQRSHNPSYSLHHPHALIIHIATFTFTHHTHCTINLHSPYSLTILVHSSYTLQHSHSLIILIAPSTFTHHTHCTIHIRTSQGAVGGIISAESMAATNAWVQGYIDTCGADPMAIATAVSVVIRDFIDSA
jgi:hypothetical protein